MQNHLLILSQNTSIISSPMEDTTMTNNHNIERYSYSPAPGYIFQPTDDLLIDFLKIKLESRNSNFKNSVHDPFQDYINWKIPDLDVYNQLPTPENLPAGCWKLEAGQKGWFFFTPRERKFPNGKLTKRTTSEGFWKATGGEKPIVKNSNVTGYKRSLVFYSGCKKTDWLMQEYWCTKIPNRKRTNSGDLKFDDWVLCLIYKKHEARLAEEQVKTPTAAAVEQKSLGTSNCSNFDIDEQAGYNIEQRKMDNNAQQVGWASFQSSDQQAEYEYFTKSGQKFFDHMFNQISASMNYDSNDNVHLASYCPESSE